jgi:hypothetical protein
MDLKTRIDSFIRLGDLLSKYPGDIDDDILEPLREAARQSTIYNPWFTSENIRLAINGLGEMLQTEKIEKWLQPYPEINLVPAIQKTVSVVMAGNIPLAGFHDFLCVLITGNKILARLSSDDSRLLPAIAQLLTKFDASWSDQIAFTTERIEKFDAVIATGNNNTSRYFEYYFSKVPNIIRHNRNSLAITNGNESKQELEKLASDVMQYFGMGCRSVSKVYIPFNYDLKPLINALDRFSEMANHHKYRNNYDYQQSVFMLNRIPVVDTGYLLMTESAGLSSPISVLYYSYYDKIEDVIREIRNSASDIQCVVSNVDLAIETVKPGEAQSPQLWDYADNIDTLKFIIRIS